MHVLHRTIHIRELQREEENGKKRTKEEKQRGDMLSVAAGCAPRRYLQVFHCKGGVAASAPGEGKKKCSSSARRAAVAKVTSAPFGTSPGHQCRVRVCLPSCRVSQLRPRHRMRTWTVVTSLLLLLLL